VTLLETVYLFATEHQTPPDVPADTGTDATTQIIIAALGAGGLGAIAAALITGLFSKRKLGSEATEIITRAASGVVTSIEAELERQIEARKTAEKNCMETINKMAEAHVKEREEWRRVLQLHVAWDQIALAKLTDHDVELPPVPPLLPASRHVDEHGHPL
jgi:uncharacterized metal-binding protein